ncbi:MAG: XisI protein [Blastocatellia bacterium]
MDKLNRYREIIKEIVARYASWIPRNPGIRTEVVLDPTNDHYEVIRIGWQGDYRLHGSVIHLDIINGKVWIQHDSTNRPVADALLEAGVPHEDIVLAFHPPEVRQYTEFAAA